MRIAEYPTNLENRWGAGERKLTFRVKAKSYYDAERILGERLTRLLGDQDDEPLEDA